MQAAPKPRMTAASWVTRSIKVTFVAIPLLLVIRIVSTSFGPADTTTGDGDAAANLVDVTVLPQPETSLHKQQHPLDWSAKAIAADEAWRPGQRGDGSRHETKVGLGGPADAASKVAPHRMAFEVSRGISYSELDLCQQPNHLMVCDDAHKDCSPGCKWETRGSVGQAPQLKKFLGVPNDYVKDEKPRMAKLQKILDRTGLGDHELIHFMFFNWGFLYQFFNWACSAEAHGIEVRSTLLILVSEQETAEALIAEGFHAVVQEDFGNWHGKLDLVSSAAHRFALGAHASLNSLAIGLLNDLVQMGHNVLMMDCDLVWARDPRVLLLQMAHDSKYDILGLDEGRFFTPGQKFSKSRDPLLPDRLPEGPRYQLQEETQHGDYKQINTGFVLVRSTPMSKFFMASVVQALPLVLWQRSDQLIWNNLLYHSRQCFSYNNRTAWNIYTRDSQQCCARVSNSLMCTLLRVKNMDFPRHLIPTPQALQT